MRKLYSEVIATAILAGKKILEYYGKVDYELKDDLSPITQADIESNTFIVTSLKNLNTYPVCTEESPISLQERNESEFYWLVDPLDGTKDFIAQTDHFTINIALMQNHIPIFGVVYIPAMKKLYAGGEEIGFWGLRGGEVDEFVNQPKWEKVRRLWHKEYFRAQLIGCDSKFHSTQEGLKFFEKYKIIKKSMGSSVKFCSLALGVVDIYPRFNGSKEWDTAAGDAILRSVGGFLYDIETKEILKYGKKDLKNHHFIAFSPSLKERYGDFLK